MTRKKKIEAIVVVKINIGGEIYKARIRLPLETVQRAERGNSNCKLHILMRAKKQLGINTYIELDTDQWNYQVVNQLIPKEQLALFEK